MAGLSPHFSTEGDESSPNASNVFGEVSGSNQLTVQARPRRQKAFHAKTLVILVAGLVLLTAMITCLHLSRQKVRKHEGTGRRLASGEDEENETFVSHMLEGCKEMEEELKILRTQIEGEDKFLSSVLVDGLETQDEFGFPRSEGLLPEKTEAIPHILSPFEKIHRNLSLPHSEELLPDSAFSSADSGLVPLDQPQTITSPPPSAFFPADSGLVPLDQLQTFTSPPRSPFSPADAGLVPLDQLQIFTSPPPSPEILQPYLSEQTPAMSTPDALLPAELDSQPLPDVSTTEHPEQPTSLATKKRTKRSPSASAPKGLSKRKRKRFAVAESPDLQQDAVKSARHEDLVAAATTGQQVGQLQPPPAKPAQPSATPQRAESESAESSVASTSSDLSVGTSHPPASSVPPHPEVPSAMSPFVVESLRYLQAVDSFALPEPASLTPLDTHLYYRLPVLQPGLISEEFNARRAFSPGRIACPHAHLLEVHRLLAQPVVTASEAVLIIKACEEIANFLLHKHRASVQEKKPSVAANRLARRYLSLEAIFCAIQVIGPPMRAETWWRELLQFIPTDYQFSTKFLARKTRGARLAFRLSSALASLKHGIRPSMETTVQLKRDIFTCKDYEFGITHEKWDPWRKDDDGAEGSAQS
ncbi:hypothetical protein Emag_000565 [Eimeria magna]